MAQPPTEIVSYAPMPADASEQDIAQYQANLARARHERTNVDGLRPIDRLVKQEISDYLTYHYDPRPLEQIAGNVRSVIMSQMGRR
ncbi:MAG TPA: hypothetical protein VGX25_33020 [Actinophytocola sp.]|uniref:hypothetical protein n=1 Tax=Actinophytocola sp. TaxID=1872138 RepID=UPI002DDCA356|nr:hypothetical protein [Actinophytocola sp.]HEV2784234.1 hypothetical protein [Actinophytocola sp.]